ncbi:histone-fold-containing protein [Xylona heveae TC161]|uniref:DNA polymerase epsilon subunit D n=1 Tax=Xylona heveae (strain CBS 132557 / TC161) TaxID=1328760 RepID=A0A165GIQ0_XYLHT|nr:histone-fold-containing protein [Xylona heveae TC161]KZF22231.1 histone-fold-containing protein [Xylona heveae TC161]
MPPKKSDGFRAAAAAAPGATQINAADTVASPSAKDKDGMGIEDLSLPRAMVQRLAKSVLPANTQIQKDAVLAISKSATVFVNYLSSYANEAAQRANKKTIMPNDVFDAIKEIEFEAFLPRLEAELTKYNSIQVEKRNKNKQKKDSAAETGPDADAHASPTETAARSKGFKAARTSTSPSSAKIPREVDATQSHSGPPAAKKAKTESGNVAAEEEEEDFEDGEDQEQDGEDDEENDEEGEEEEEDDVDEEGKDEDMDRNHKDEQEDDDDDEGDLSD